jgi:hypothetical protein
MPLTQADRRRGGMHSHIAGTERLDPISLRSAGDIIAAIEHEMNIARGMARGVQRGRLIGFLCNVALRALDVGALESRLHALEQQIGELTRSRAA